MTITLRHAKWTGLAQTLEEIGTLVVAVSGGVDSLLLATLAHARLGGRTVMAHAVSPAVPAADTDRVRDQASVQGWRLLTVNSGEFEDERYLSNPYDRCYFCKSHLYSLLQVLSADLAHEFGRAPVIVSGANTDDLGEHRPGLAAAKERGIRHPFVEADVSKADIRAMARELALPFADLPASPCLSSRVYTGTRVTPERLQAVAWAEGYLKLTLGVSVVRCRIRQDQMLVELAPEGVSKVPPDTLKHLEHQLRGRFSTIAAVSLDPEGYRPGRAFLPES
ncbi:ATP-dependent sacrificial sulfur transferase LarE [Fundidesulfovibrio butyratiphilus]